MSVKPNRMNLAVAIIILGCLVADGSEVGASTNTPAASPGGPRIQFAETYFDFGQVQSGRIVTHDFAFTNIGNAVLEISDVNSSCGCTAVTNWDRRISPGQAGSLHVLFNTGGMAGPETKNLWVSSNDPNQPTLFLEFTATIWKWIDAIPTVAAFSFGPDFQTNETRVIQLVSNLKEPVKLSAPVCTNRAFKAELKTVVPGKEYELEVSVIPPLGPGSLVVPITLKTSAPEMPVVTVTAYALVEPALTVTPPRLRVSTPLAEAKRFVVTIRNNGSTHLDLSDPGINAEGAGVQLRELQPGRLFELAVTFPAGFQNHPGQAIEARVKSNSQQSPIIHVPIFQQEAPAEN